MKTYYTIFLGEKPFENVIDDMNPHTAWGTGGMFWPEENQAIECMNNLKNPVFGLEDEHNKFKVVSFQLPVDNLLKERGQVIE